MDLKKTQLINLKFYLNYEIKKQSLINLCIIFKFVVIKVC